jgi:hypothetical protein
MKETDTQLQNEIDALRERVFKSDNDEGSRITRLHNKFENFQEFMIKNDLGPGSTSPIPKLTLETEETDATARMY